MRLAGRVFLRLPLRAVLRHGLERAGFVLGPNTQPQRFTEAIGGFKQPFFREWQS